MILISGTEVLPLTCVKLLLVTNFGQVVTSQKHLRRRDNPHGMLETLGAGLTSIAHPSHGPRWDYLVRLSTLLGV